MSKRIFQDAFNLLCSDKLGSGVYRDVYACRLDKTLVVKVEIEQEWRSFSNVKEMQFWNENELVTSVAKWLAPCEYLSPDGRILLQKRVQPLTDADKKKLPDKVPSFLTDLKFDNFGMYEGRLVCIDYASVILNASVKLKKADWWS